MDPHHDVHLEVRLHLFDGGVVPRWVTDGSICLGLGSKPVGFDDVDCDVNGERINYDSSAALDSNICFGPVGSTNCGILMLKSRSENVSSPPTS